MNHTLHPQFGPRGFSLALASVIVMTLIILASEEWADAIVYLGQVLALAGLSFGFWTSITNWDLAYPDDKDSSAHA